MLMIQNTGLTCDPHQYLALEIRYKCTDAQILVQGEKL
jgi:hypothetical protein